MKEGRREEEDATTVFYSKRVPNQGRVGKNKSPPGPNPPTPPQTTFKEEVGGGPREVSGNCHTPPHPFFTSRRDGRQSGWYARSREQADRHRRMQHRS